VYDGLMVVETRTSVQIARVVLLDGKCSVQSCSDITQRLEARLTENPVIGIRHRRKTRIISLAMSLSDSLTPKTHP